MMAGAALDDRDGGGDIAALAVIVREAGGLFTDLNGQPLTLDSRSVLAGTPDIHEAVLKRLRSAR